MFSAGSDWATDAESDPGFSRYANGHRGGIFWRLHYFFQLWMGDCENAGRRGMASRDNLRGGKRNRGTFVVRCWNPAGKQVLNVHFNVDLFSADSKRVVGVRRVP